MRPELYRVQGPRHEPPPVIGLEVLDGRVVRAAAVARWAVGRPVAEVAAIFRRRGWTVERLGDEARP